VIVLNQCKMLDLSVRGAKLVERAPADVVEEALAKLQAVVA
jgi:mRNA interferase ChpB